MSNQNKNLWESFGGKGFSAEYAEYSECASSDVNGNDIVATYAKKAELPTVNDAKLKLQLGSGQATDTGFTANSSVDATITVPEMTGATASTAGASGIVPAPAVADKDKFLKGDGTWDTPIFDKNYSSVWGGSPSTAVYGMFQVTVGRDQSGGYSGAPRTLNQVGRNGVLGYLLPEPVEGTIPVSVKDNGNNKCYALKTLRQLGALAAKDTYVNGGTIHSLVISAPDKPASIFTYTDEGNHELNYWGVPYNPNGTTGQVLTFNSSSGPYWAMPANPLPTPTHDNELFVGMSDGTSSWKQLTTVGMSTQLLDENDDPILDELGNAVYDNQPTLWYKLDDRGFYAERALADSDGREIKTTYSTVASTESAISTASQQLTQQMETGYQRKLILGRDNESVEPRREYIPQNNEYVVASVFLLTNNKITRLTPMPLTDGHVFRFLCNVTGTTNECPNFGIEFDTIGSGSSTVEIYIQPNGARSAYLAHPSVSGGTTISAGKFYQITCCGTCWTLAEFGTANA